MFNTLEIYSYVWIYHDWTACSTSCGGGGIRKKTTGCFRVLKDQENVKKKGD